MHPSRLLARVVAALAMVGALTIALAAPVAAADPVTIQARALLGGRFEDRGWAALSVVLENSGEPVSGYLVTESDAGTTRRFVELPAGSRKAVTLYVRPQAFARTIAVTFADESGERLAAGEAEVRVLERGRATVAVVGDGAGALRPQLASRAGQLPEPIALGVADFPERPEPLRGFEAIVWAADSSGLTEAQRRALERWVAAGGQLIVIGGPDWQARTAGFASLLPVTGLRSVDAADLASLGALAGVPLPDASAGLTASLGTAADGAVLLAGSGDAALAATATRGAGRVTWFGVDLATDAFRDWAGGGPLWSRVIADSRFIEQFFGGVVPEEESAFILAQALQALPALEVPPAELLLGVLVAYILLIGPVSYVVLHRLDRRELAWITAPVLVVVFSASSYGIGSAMKGTDIILNEVAVIRTTDGAAAASVSTYAGLYSPARASYDLLARGDALFSAIDGEFFGGEPRAASYLTEQGDPSRLRGLAIGAFVMQAVRAESTIAYAPSLGVDWWLTEEGLAGTVTNHGTEQMDDVAVVTGGGGLMVGNLAAGASRDFEITRRQLNGGSASELIYGFSGIDVGNEASRRIQVRRGVIDTLVGYGGLRDAVVGLGGIDQGPFVIGWRVGASPVAVEVEGERIQHFVQAVEVLSGRPRLTSGSVTIRPSHMATAILGTAGEAGESEPGFVTVGNGEVEFGITLPLDATGLRPTSVTLIAANDPGAVFFDQGNFVSVLPDGYRMAVYDVRAGAWTDVGDLSARSRFTIEDPGSVLDATGRIRIRIAGSGIPAEVGQMPVFAGASVSGVLDR